MTNPPDREINTYLSRLCAACAANLPLYTRNPEDVTALDDLVEIIALP